MTMLVLSPSVEAMKTSAFSIPAASSASVSRPAPTVNWPPRSSQLFSRPTSSRACDSGSSSRQETSWPSRSIARATEEPTRPQPTIRTNMERILVSPALSRVRRSREQDPAGSFLQHVLRRGADLSRLGGADPADHRPAADLGRRLTADHDRFRVAAAGRLEDPGADLAGADHLGGHLDVLVLLPHLTRPLQRPRRLLLALLRQLRVERQRQRHLDHVDDVEPRIERALPRAGLRGREPPRGGDDVVVELGSEYGHEDVAEFDLRHLLGQRPLGDRDALGQGRALEDPAVDDVEAEPEGHPAEPDPAR